jgi:hypothetical protein
MSRAFAFALLFAALVPLTGCGAKVQDITGSVSLDGKSVADASVTLFSSDGKTFGGGTDASGNFAISAVPSGEYKAIVAKYPKVAGTSPGDSGTADKAYIDSMKKNLDKASKPGGVMPMPGKGGMPMMPVGMGSGGSSTKSELPEQYASLEKTPLTVKVPSDGPIQLQLKSK